MTSSLFESLPEEQRALLLNHLDLVIEANKTTNLTRIDDVESALVLHIEDSLTALEELDKAPRGLYGDLGTGAGYPGIPLGVVSGRKTMLIDSRKKKVDILDSIIGKLGLDGQFDTFAGRAELLARKNPSSFTALTARALSQLSVLLELASPLLAKGGLLICYKSNVSDDELSNAERVQSIVGMELVSDRSFTLSDESTNRRILTYKKVRKPKISLPRLEGKAQKDPL